MKISLTNIGKRYNSQWIFRGVSHQFIAGNSYAILGNNGSGKSTLLQIISGSLSANEGDTVYKLNGKKILDEQLYKYISISTPYLELIEEFTLEEIINFHFKFKKTVDQLTTDKVASTIELTHVLQKQLKHFSSGMKQRVKLGLAILSDVPVVLLDEPSTNLDERAVEWYNKLIELYKTNRIIIVCSNKQKNEYGFCNEMIDIDNYKTQPIASTITL